MLKITVPRTEFYDRKTGRFIDYEAVSFELEHSLVSLSKWESFWEKPFISEDDKTSEEVLWYIKAMTLTPDVTDDVYERLTSENLEAVRTYINAKMTATWFSDTPTKSFSTEVVTAEIIYYWMIAFQVPFECQHWHLERLLTLIKVCEHKNADQSKKKTSRSEFLAKRRSLQAQRRAQYS